MKKGAWRDTFMLSLKPNEKLLYTWLFTNDYVNCAGIQEINESIMRFETGLRYPIHTLSILYKTGRIVQDGPLVWVRNFIKSQFKVISPKLEAGIIRCLEACPSQLILYAFGKTYGQIPYPYPIDTPLIPQGSTLIPGYPDTLDTLGTLDTQDTIDTQETAAGAAYLTYKKRNLTGFLLSVFNEFWGIWRHPRYGTDKSKAGDSWLDLPWPDRNKDAVENRIYKEKILRGARAFVEERNLIIEKGDTPIYAQGWLSERRFESYLRPEDEEGLRTWVMEKMEREKHEQS